MDHDEKSKLSKEGEQTWCGWGEKKDSQKNVKILSSADDWYYEKVNERSDEICECEKKREISKKLIYIPRPKALCSGIHFKLRTLNGLINLTKPFNEITLSISWPSNSPFTAQWSYFHHRKEDPIFNIKTTYLFDDDMFLYVFSFRASWNPETS